MSSRGDLLLRWLSCYTELRAARVQAAAERLCAPPLPIGRDDPRLVPYLNAAKRLTRNLARLGHIEELSADRYRTVPPTIVAQVAGRHLVTGARSESVLDGLAKAHGVSLLPAMPQHEGPSVRHLIGSDEAVAAAARAVGIIVIRDRGTDLLGSLPALFDTLAGASLEGIADRTERWNSVPVARRSRWTRTTDSDTPGLYRSIRKPHHWYFRSVVGAPSVRLDSRERRIAAAWWLLRGAERVSYAPVDGVLAIPAIGFGLPLLVDRAIILASGRLPELRGRQWCYSDVEPERARHVARILGVSLEVKS